MIQLVGSFAVKFQAMMKSNKMTTTVKRSKYEMNFPTTLHRHQEISIQMLIVQNS